MRYIGSILIIIVFVTGLTVFAQDDDFSLPITEDVEYTVRPADTLDGIGALFDVSPSCLADTNDITDARTIRPGDTLLITVECPLYGDDARDQVFQEVAIPREVVTFKDECEGYRVQRNDSIDLIGFNLDVAPLSIASVNGLESPYVLQINQCLEIPDGAPPYDTVPALTNVDGSPVSEASLGQGGGAGQYVIQPRDSLDLVAQELDVSLQALLIFNNIDDPSSLTAGTVIFIPADAPAYGVFPAIGVDVTGSLYVVAEGDTLESIAESFDIAQVALEVANELDSDDDLVVGETVNIPYNVPAFGDDDDFDPSVLLGQGGGGEIHVVQPRETIDGIAAFYNVDRQCLLDANDITQARLVQPGTPIVIDRNCPEYVGDGIPSVSQVTSPVDTDTSDEE
ncbi:MAG: LysM peptidoglycan-binding domain-containing protein [Chloroflexota bacterium]